MKRNIFVHTVSRNCRAAVVHGFSRKTAKCAVFVQRDKDCGTPLEDKTDSKTASSETSDAVLALSLESKKDLDESRPPASKRQKISGK